MTKAKNNIKKLGIAELFYMPYASVSGSLKMPSLGVLKVKRRNKIPSRQSRERASRGCLQVCVLRANCRVS